MLGRKDKTREKNAKVRKVSNIMSYIFIGLIAINYVTYIAYEINYRINGWGVINNNLYDYPMRYFPTFIAAFDCVVLVIGLVWICCNLCRDSSVKVNKCCVCVHPLLILISLGPAIAIQLFFNY
jgi:amino acid permease